MDKKLDKKALAAAVGTVFAVSLASAPIASADSNPFGISELSGGYQQVAAEGQCGGMDKAKEASCGGKGKMEGICGADANKDGKITEAEFIAAKGEGAKGKFMQFDANKDGALNADELAKLKAAGKPAMPKGKAGSCGEGKCGK